MAEEKRKFPSEVVDLPSKGLLYPKDHPCSSGQIEIKYMTAKEEDILTSRNLIQKGISKYVTRSLTSIYSLQTSLDFEKGGEIAINLFHLYEFCRLQIIAAFSKNKNDGLKKAFDALNEIISAWGTIKV